MEIFCILFEEFVVILKKEFFVFVLIDDLSGKYDYGKEFFI